MAGIVFCDGFSGSGEISTPDKIGTGWTRQVQTGSQTVVRNAGEAEPGTDEEDDALLYTCDDDPATAEYDLVAYLDVFSTSTEDVFFLIARYTDTNNYYTYGQWHGADATDNQIHKVVSGTATQLATANPGAAADDRMRFEVRDSRKAGFKNAAQGTPTLSTTDDALTSTGKGGIGYGNLINAGDNIETGIDMENFLLLDADKSEAFDDFYEDSSTALTSHTADTGETWTLSEQTGSTTWTIPDDDSAIDNSGFGESSDRLTYTSSLTPTGADYDVWFVLGTNAGIGTDDPIWSIGRYADNSNFYFGGTYGASAAADKKIYKEVSSTVTQLATGDNGFAAEDVILLEIKDAAKKLFHNGSEILSSTDNAITAKGSAGIGCGNHAVSTDDVSNTSEVDKWGVTNGVTEADIDLAPGQGNLTITTTAPTVQVTQRFQPDHADLALSSEAPALKHDLGMSPDAADLVFSAQAPAVQQTENFQPDAADLVISSDAPALKHDLGMSPAAADLVLSTHAPAVQVTINFQPDSGDLVLSTAAPALKHDLGMSPDAAQLVLSTEAPTRAHEDNHPITVGSADLVIASVAPDVLATVGIGRVPDAADLTLSTTAPTRSLIFNISPEAAQLIIDSVAPDVEGGSTALVGWPDEGRRHPRPRRYILPDGRRILATPEQMAAILADFLEERRQAFAEHQRKGLREARQRVERKPLDVPPVEAPTRPSYGPSEELQFFRDQPLPDDLAALELIALEYFIRRRDEEEAILVLLLAT